LHLLVFHTWMKFALLHGMKHTKLSTTFFRIFTPLTHFLLLLYPFNTYPHPSQLWPFLRQKRVTLSVLVAKWSEAKVCRRSLALNTGSNPARGMDDCECRGWSRRCLYDGAMPGPQEFYRMCCVNGCDPETSRMRRPWPDLGCYAREEWSYMFTLQIVRILTQSCHPWK
jgi:hypothetical protein